MRVLVGALVLVLCAWRTHDRAMDWRSDEALWSAAVVSAPDLPRPALSLGMAYARLGHWEQSAAWTGRAADLAHDPRHAWILPPLCLQINRLLVLMPDPPSFSVECAS